MLLYEHDRTSDIVKRLVTIGNIIHIVTIASYVIVLGAIFSLVGVPLLDDAWWIGGISGIVIGYVLGSYIASLFTVVIEWMAQLLVAQGEILAALKKELE